MVGSNISNKIILHFPVPCINRLNHTEHASFQICRWLQSLGILHFFLSGYLLHLCSVNIALPCCPFVIRSLYRICYTTWNLRIFRANVVKRQNICPWNAWNNSQKMQKKGVWSNFTSLFCTCVCVSVSVCVHVFAYNYYLYPRRPWFVSLSILQCLLIDIIFSNDLGVLCWKYLADMSNLL